MTARLFGFSPAREEIAGNLNTLRDVPCLQLVTERNTQTRYRADYRPWLEVYLRAALSHVRGRENREDARQLYQLIVLRGVHRYAREGGLTTYVARGIAWKAFRTVLSRAPRDQTVRPGKPGRRAAGESSGRRLLTQFSLEEVRAQAADNVDPANRAEKRELIAQLLRSVDKTTRRR